MTSTRNDLEGTLIIERKLWTEGPPHELFRRLRAECPVHWTSRVSEYPHEKGFWSVTRPEDIHTVSRDWRTYSSELGGVTAVTEGFPLELLRAMFIGMDPPKHDRLKMLFQAGFTPKRIAAHEPAIRAIVVDVLDLLHGRETCELVGDVAQPAVSRVIGSFMGIPPEDDAAWASLMNSALGAGDPDLNPGGVESVAANDIPEIFERCRRMIAERREHPTDDLTSVLVHAEIDGQKLEEHEIVMGFFLLVAAGNDSTKATYCSGMRALMEHPDQRQLLLDDPSLVAGAVEEALRMFPAFAHFRRTATCDTELAGQPIREGDKVVMGFFLLVAAGNDSTKATYCSGMRALMENPDQRQMLLEDPSLVAGAVEESLRMFPAFAHFRRTATCDTELAGQPIREGDKVVMWYVSSNRDESRYPDPDRFDVRRNSEHQAFGAGGRHFCLGTALARLELKVLFEETLARYPAMEMAGGPVQAESAFINQLKALPVRLGR